MKTAQSKQRIIISLDLI